MSDSTPVGPERSEEAVAAGLVRAAPAFAPGWQPEDRGPGAAVVRVFTRYLDTLAERIDAAPDKNRLAFFEQLGIDLSPAQAARAPVVFEALPNVGDSSIPARTRVGAEGPDGALPLVFETERAIGLAAAPLVEVVTLWPARDAYADHSAAALHGDPFTLFEPLRPVPHVFYLGHEVLAIAGESTIELDVELDTAAGEPLAIAWEHWDGEGWRPFKPFEAHPGARDSEDATRGLTRSGVIRLAADCGASLPTRVDGLESVWVRGRLTDPLPPDGPPLPSVRRVALRTTVDRALPVVACGALSEDDGLIPDAGIGGARKLDFTTAVQPLGAQPQAGDAFYLAGEDALARPGAEVTLCFTKVETADEVVDQLGAEYEEDANNAQRVVLQAAIHAARALRDAGRSALSIIRRTSLLPLPQPLPPNYQSLADAASALSAELASAELELNDATANDRGVDLEAVLDPLVEPARAVAYWLYNTNAPPHPPGGEPDPPLPPPVVPPENRETGLENPQPFDTFPFPFPTPLWPWPWGTTPFVTATVPNLIDAAGADPLLFAERLAAFIADNDARVRQAGTLARDAVFAANESVEQLDILTPIDAVRAAGIEPPALPDPVVAWEYWNGSRWRSLVVGGTAGARTFREDGPVTFTVPDDLEPVEVNGDERRWVRARLLSGGYGTVRMVSWRDEQTQRLNFFPIVQVRPPSLETVRIGYRHRSPWVGPRHAIAYNDFRWVDHADTLRERRDAVLPYEPVEDRTPSVYLGFDGRLPADRIGIFLGVREDLDRPTGPRLVWEAWTGQAWERIPVEDGTRGLAVPGIAAVLWPGTAEPPSARVVEGRATTLTTESPAHAARFAAGQRVQLRQGSESELARVVGVEGRTIRLRSPLERDYRAATVEVAALPRFGAPRSWIRVRLEVDGTPPRPRLDALLANAVWAVHAETREEERLGGSDGQPDQVFFARARPVLEGEVLEVRELEGARAHVEEAILREELAAAGVPEEAVRTTTDPRTGRTDAVWVRWRRRASLLFAPGEGRDYAIDHSRGRILFGDGDRGRIPPAGRDNIRFLRYLTGGGVAGNVDAGAVDQVLAGVLAGGVENVLPAQGGADVESLDRLRWRAPTVVRHRSQAITAADYEALALQATPAVAVARALPTTHPSGRQAPGWVTLRIVPHSSDPRPYPSFELRDRVRRYLAARAPASIARQIAVRPAEFLPVGVTAAVAVADTDAAASVRDAVLQELRRFLHPLTGGPEGRGWPFGRDVFLSDVAALLESLRGVDFVATLGLDRDGQPAGERLSVPEDRMVVAGPLRVTLTGE